MKNKIVLSFLFAFLCFLAFAQTTKGTLYKSDHWADIKGKGGFAKAMNNPTYEKVEILKTDKNIKVTFGTKVFNYIIVSSKQFSSVKMDYTVTLKGKTFLLSIADMQNGTYAVNIDGNWMVSDITNFTTVDIK
ncbi:MAG: hypothetical protein ACKVQV_08240 [Bacteroidia bacterium]